MSTKLAPVNMADKTYYFQITLNDGTSILLQYGPASKSSSGYLSARHWGLDGLTGWAIADP